MVKKKRPMFLVTLVMVYDSGFNDRVGKTRQDPLEEITRLLISIQTPGNLDGKRHSCWW